MSERCPRCENERFGSMVASLLEGYRRDLAQLDARGAEHSCQVEDPPAQAPEPEPLPPEPTPPHPDPALERVPRRPRQFDWEA